MSAGPRTISRPIDDSVSDYPVSDGQPMAETPTHRRNMTDTIATLERYYADEVKVYISGNMFIYYAKNDRRRHVSPDTFVVFGVPREERDAYFTWLEPKPSLDLAIEFTSRSTQHEDIEDKFHLYQNVIGVTEYLMFDPYEDYLRPPQQLYRLVRGRYRLVRPVAGRLPSKVLGLHFDRDGRMLRLYDPTTKGWLPTPGELVAEHDDTLARLADVEDENDRLRRELNRLKKSAASKRGNGTKKNGRKKR